MKDINRKKLIYAILREANNNSDIDYTNESFKVDELVFTQVLITLKEEKLLTGILVLNADNKVSAQISSNEIPRITLSGVEFLEENNSWSKLYKGIKEIKGWLPL